MLRKKILGTITVTFLTFSLLLNTISVTSTANAQTGASSDVLNLVRMWNSSEENRTTSVLIISYAWEGIRTGDYLGNQQNDISCRIDRDRYVVTSEIIDVWENHPNKFRNMEVVRAVAAAGMVVCDKVPE